MKNRNRSRQSGFTLVEIAIVLVIIGLLLGGVLKGQELIENAKIKNLKNDYQGIAAAYYAYKDRYNAIPGDDAAAAARWVGSTAATPATVGNGVITGGYNAGCGLANGSEACVAWEHLRRAGLISGNVNTANPANAYGGTISIYQQAGTLGGAAIGLNVCMGSLPAKAAEAIDASFDDGVGNVGQIRATLGTANIAPGAAVAPYVDNGTNTYTVCKVL
jgi:prepilin-type N-terminal cleavage/methylation domain-containing protein